MLHVYKKYVPKRCPSLRLAFTFLRLKVSGFAKLKSLQVYLLKVQPNSCPSRTKACCSCCSEGCLNSNETRKCCIGMQVLRKGAFSGYQFSEKKVVQVSTTVVDISA